MEQRVPSPPENQKTPAEPSPVAPASAISRFLPRLTRGQWTVAVLLSMFASSLAGAVLGLRPARDRILPGITVWDVAIGAKTQTEARSALARQLVPYLDRPFLLVDGSRQWTVTARELGCRFDIQKIVRDAYELGRKGPLLARWRTAWVARRHGLALKPKVTIDRALLRARLRQIAALADIPAREATIRLQAGGFVITPEQVGRLVDVDATEKNIVRYFAPVSHRRVALVMRVDYPRVTAKDLAKIDGRLASYTTRYNPADVNRSANLLLAARALDGTVIPPGDVFSYNATVGPRTEQRGYRVAKIFRRGEILDGVGGGICQVASTLYNAAAAAGMRILERARHSRPVTYVPPGRDATVSYDGVDFRFRNPTDAPVLIHSRAGGGVLTIDLYGKRPTPKTRKQGADSRAESPNRNFPKGEFTLAQTIDETTLQ